MNNKKILIVGSISNILEWYDYSLFGHLVVLLGSKFFPSSDARIAALYGFLVFGLGFIARPAGGVIWGIIGDKFGRKIALRFSVMCMAIPTFVVGVLPTYQNIGITATVVMIATRMLQGFAMGGALTSSISFLIEHTPEKNKGLIGSIPISSICLGVLLSSGVLSLTKFCLTSQQFNEFGWRIPFLLGIVLIFLSHYIKTNTIETPVFQSNLKHNEIPSSPVKEVFNLHKTKILSAIGLNATGSILFYLQAVYLGNYLKIEKGIDEKVVDIMINSSYFLMFFVVLFAGYISSIFGRKKFYIYLLSLISILTPSIMYGIENTDSVLYLSIFISILTVLSGSYIAAEPAFMTELYDSKTLNTAMAISYGIATALFGGATPYILNFMYTKFNTITSFTYYILVSSALGLVSVLVASRSRL